MDLIGKTIAGYQIVEQIGKGGMATIYRAHQPSLDRDVAIKVLPPYYAEQDASFLERFRREAQAVANLRHPNILVVLDFGESDSYAYIVMEYVEAGTLKDLMQKPLTLKSISALITQIADALDYAHSRGVVHRDIKPSNILMPKPEWALLTDFGLAKMVGGDLLTQSGLTVGTPAYMSPEQGSGEGVDARSDIYSLGVMLYEMVLGETPYQAETPMAVVIKHITDPLPIISNVADNVPLPLQRVILKALAKDPDDRYQSAGELAKALAQVAEEYADWTVVVKRVKPDQPETKVVLPESKEVIQPAKRPSGRWKVFAGVAASAVVLAFFAVVALAGVAWWWFFGRTPAVTSSNQEPTATFAVVAEVPTTIPTEAPPTPTFPPEPSPTFAGVILFEDDFSNTSSGWDRDHDQDGYVDYVNNAYRIRIEKYDIAWWANPYLLLDDVRVEFDAKFVDGSLENSYGVLCGYQDVDNFYYISFDGTGYYSFWQQTGGEWVFIDDSPGPSDAFNSAEEGNHIRVDCVGDTISLYVNDQFVDSITGLEIPRGDVGLIAETSYDDLIEIEFDNFVVYEP